MPNKFSESGAQAPDGQLNLDRWWSSFNDPLLEQLISDTVKGNKDLQSAIARVNQSRALYNQTFLDLFPTITADGQYTNSNINVRGRSDQDREESYRQ